MKNDSAFIDTAHNILNHSFSNHHCHLSVKHSSFAAFASGAFVAFASGCFGAFVAFDSGFFVAFACTGFFVD
jgi:hypothetical protein